jgi:hypothetical protein
MQFSTLRMPLAALLAYLTVVSAWLPAHKVEAEKRAKRHIHQHHHRGENSAGSHHELVKKWTPTNGEPIRGVNLGSFLIFEQWLATNEWTMMGCGSTPSERECTAMLGQSTANAAFQAHWASWINETDIGAMSSYGLNTIRIPIGYWINEDLVYPGETFPQGGLEYLENICNLAANYGFYVIIDLQYVYSGTLTYLGLQLTFKVERQALSGLRMPTADK